jgi:PP-loop superfamily ATP-utilizing enzyme
VQSLEKAGAGIKLVTVATQCSIQRQRRRAADDAGKTRHRHVVAATTGVALRIRG